MNAQRRAVLAAQMRESLEAIQEYTRGLTRDDFFRNRVVQDAVYMRIIAFAESARKFLDAEPDAREEFQDVDWNAVFGMRNVIAHDYFNVLPEVIWNTVLHDVPKALALVSRLERDL